MSKTAYTPVTYQGGGRPVAHAPNCDCPTLLYRFKCDVCGRIRGWCLGAHDNMPGACDFCWVDDEAAQ